MCVGNGGRAWAGSLVVGLLVGGSWALGGLGASYAGQQRAGAMTGAPTVGTCSTMTAAQAGAAADHSTVVDCTVAHTAQVAGVVKLPRGMQWSSASRVDLYRVVASACEPEVNATLGRDAAARDSSAYDFVWFEPTKAQRSAGARWLSCSVVRPKATRLATLPTSATPFLPGGRLPDAVARCLTRSADDTPCSAGHLWRATGTFTLAGRFPRQTALAKRAAAKCPSRVTGGSTFRWAARDKYSWNLGHDHVVVCFTKTRS
jgi:hypothetical protein